MYIYTGTFLKIKESIRFLSVTVEYLKKNKYKTFYELCERVMRSSFIERKNTSHELKSHPKAIKLFVEVKCSKQVRKFFKIFITLFLFIIILSCDNKFQT